MIQDVRDGFTDAQLMEKYSLSTQGLEHFYNRGLNIGKLEINDLQRDNGRINYLDLESRINRLSRAKE